MEIYLVGGAVRDKLLGLPVKDRDWVVVGGSPRAMLDLGYRQVGKDFPVFLHPESNEEYALARTERKTAPGHTGFSFDTSESVSLEEDLQRRDLTINAIAEDSEGKLVDPYGGVADCENRILRHVSDAFSEDPLRVLRVARFAARFAHLGFRVAEDTNALMRKMVASGELEALVGERVWTEMHKALVAASPAEFVRVLRYCNALAIILPEVNDLFGVPQPEKYHPEIDTGIHTLMCLEQARKLSDDSAVLYATLVHDVGKALTDRDNWPRHIAHESLGLKALTAIEQRLPLPKEHAALARLVCEHHTKLHRIQELKPATLLKLLETLDAIRRPERLQKFLLACEADARGRTGLEDRSYPQGQYLLTVLEAANNIDIPALLAEHAQGDPKALIARARLEAITDRVTALRKSEADQHDSDRH
jgi:tRNA nucleotidyltransferase (CCA-adding enzyme)